MNSDYLKVLFVFIAVYLALFALGTFTPLQEWNFSFNFAKLDYTLFLFPIPGFFFIYSLIPWIKDELGFWNLFIYIFPIVYLIGSYLAFYLAVFYYFGNQAFLSNVELSAFNLDYFDMILGFAIEIGTLKILGALDEHHSESNKLIILSDQQVTAQGYLSANESVRDLNGLFGRI